MNFNIKFFHHLHHISIIFAFINYPNNKQILNQHLISESTVVN